jgi:hypothetical protein
VNTGLTTACGVLAAAGAFCAWCSGDRGGPSLRSFAVPFFAAWVLFASSWTQWSAASLLVQAGYPARSIDLWAVTDAVLGMLLVFAGVVAVGEGRGVGLLGALWASYAVQGCLHVAYDPAGWIGWPAYEAGLNGLFLAQVALLLMIGGRGAANRILGGCRRLSGLWLLRARYQARVAAPVVGPDGQQ